MPPRPRTETFQRTDTAAGDSGGVLCTDDEYLKQVHRRNIELERDVRIAHIEEKDFERVIGSAWKTVRVQRLDFSGSTFELEDLEGLKELDKARLNRLTYMDLSNNRLHCIDYVSDSNGFEALTVLLARRNPLTDVHLYLSHLLELNLAHNMLKEPPDLTALPLLEILVLSDNTLSGSFQAFKYGRRLKSLDLSHNKYECCPSELAHGLAYLASGAKNLLNLRIYANPFIAAFPEYQVFVVKELPSLIKIDDLRISRTLRACVLSTQLFSLEVYDDQFAKRRKSIEAMQADRMGKDDDAGNKLGFGRLSVIIQELEDIIDDPTSLQGHVLVIRNHATTLTTQLRKAARRGSSKEREAIEDVFWGDVQNKNFTLVTSRTIELIMGIMERHESVRFPLIEILGHLTAASRHEFGSKCMHALGRVMLGDDLSKNQAAETMSGIVMSNIKEFCMVDVLALYSKAIIGGVNYMLRNRDIREKISDALKDLIPILVEKFIEERMIRDIPHCVKLLANLTETEDNAKEAASEELCKRCVSAIDNKSISGAPALRELFIDVLNLSENMVEHGPAHMLDMFVQYSTHVQAVSQGKAIYDTSHCVDPTDAEVLANILNFITAMIKGRESVKRDCCESFHIVDLLCKILSNHAVDPLTLKSACFCLTTILEDRDMYNKYAGGVVEELSCLLPLLQFLDGQRYCDLYKQAVRHDADEATRRMLDSADGFQVPPLTHMNNPKVCDAFMGIIKLLALFARDPEDGVVDPHRQQVHKAMSMADSEAKLLALLFMPNDDIKLEVMICIVNLPLKQIEPKEMGMLIKTIANTRNIGEGRAEEVLAYLIKMLGRLVRDKEQPGHEFRTGYAAIAISEVYNTLCRNAIRDTHGHSEEENQKLGLSCEAVNYFRFCSRESALRKAMRKNEVVNEFPNILKFEEELHSRDVMDVAIEQTWIGRSTENLLKCLAGPRALSASQKVFLRVVSRIAFVLEGRTDGLSTGGPRSMADIVADERCMWPDRTELQRQHCFMDDEEHKDRKEQIERFLELGGIMTILELISGGINTRESQARITQDVEQASGEFMNITMALENGSGQADPPDARPSTEPVMDAIMLDEENSVDKPKSLFGQKSSVFDVSEDIFVNQDNPQDKTVHPSFGVSMFLRVLHALIVVPPTDQIRHDVVQQLRQRHMLVRLVATVEAQCCLSCHIAAKFMRLLHYIFLEVAQFGRVSGMTTPSFENLRVISRYIAGYAGPVTGLLDIAVERCLEPAEEALGLEMARCMGTILIASQHVAAPGSGASPEFKAKVVQALIDPICVHLFISFILYEIQMDMGGGSRKTIMQEFVEMAYRKKGLKEQSSLCLQSLLTSCDEDLRYDVLEQFSRAEVFLSQNVRPCFLMELLYSVSLGKYMLLVERELLKQERFAHFEPVHALQAKTNTVVPMLLCVCHSTFYLLCPQDNSGEKNGQPWDPSAELGDKFVKPPIEMEKAPRLLAGIYRGFGSQLLGLQWEPRDEGAAPELTLISFQGSSVRDEVAQFLHRASGSNDAQRAKMLSDTTIREQTLKEASGDVLAVTVATVAPASSGGTVFRGAVADNAPYLFVMTTTAINQFQIHFDAWAAPGDAGTYYGGGGEFRPPELELEVGLRAQEEEQLLALEGQGGGAGGMAGAAAGITAGGMLPPTKAVVPKPDKAGFRFGCALPGFAKAAGVKKEGAPVLSFINKTDLPPPAIEFDVGLYPDLRLQGGMAIRFCDDAARERWRRALAHVCRGWGREEAAEENNK